jgi:hypothetical protein
VAQIQWEVSELLKIQTRIESLPADILYPGGQWSGGQNLREKSASGEVQKMIGNEEDLAEIWDTLHTCYERPEKYRTKALKPIIEFRRYRMVDSAAIREFYFLLRATIKSAKTVGHLKLLINGITNNMGKMPSTNWKQWQPAGQVDAGSKRGGVWRFTEQKSIDTLWSAGRQQEQSQTNQQLKGRWVI